MLRLLIEPSQGQPFERDLDADELVIGRAADADLMLADRFLSRRHARIFRKGEDFYIEDLGSRNGTLVNGTAIRVPTALRPDDVVTVSASLIRVSETKTFAGAQPTASDLSGTVLRKAAELVERHSSTEISTITDSTALQQMAERLRVLNEVHRALGSSIELEDLLELILDRVCGLMEPEDALIMLRRGEELECVAARGRSDQAAFWSETLIREVVERAHAALVLDTSADERFAQAESILSAGVRSLLAAPLLDGDTSIGMIAVASRLHVKQFDEDDMELLASFAAIAATRIRELAAAREAAERRRLQQEVEMARRIQVGLLPPHLPEIPGYEVHAGNLPSRGVSGDYYDVRPRHEGTEVVFLVADVSGKGMAASLLTASLEALTTDPIESGLPAHEICARVNARLYDRTPPDKYATVILAELAVESGRVRYANAGHNAGLVIGRDGSVEQLPATGLPLGMMPHGTYRPAEVMLAEGELLALYSDGLTEASNPEDEEFGLERLAAVLARQFARPVPEIARHVESELDRFVEGRPFADDRTLLLVRRTES